MWLTLETPFTSKFVYFTALIFVFYKGYITFSKEICGIVIRNWYLNQQCLDSESLRMPTPDYAGNYLLPCQTPLIYPLTDWQQLCRVSSGGLSKLFQEMNNHQKNNNFKLGPFKHAEQMPCYGACSPPSCFLFYLHLSFSQWGSRLHLSGVRGELQKAACFYLGIWH